MKKFNLYYSSIGTHWDIACIADSGAFQSISDDIQKLMTQFESNYSRFREDSLLARLNKMRILDSEDHHLVAMINIGELYRTLSGGYFSIFVGSQLENLGYGKNFSEVLDSNEESSVIISGDTIELRGSKNIGLGGVGKGYLIGLIQQYFIDRGIQEYCINGGGDIAISQNYIGTFGPILLQHPFHRDEYFMQLPLLRGALAGSGNMYRTWKDKKGNIIGHLIDPTTGEPAHTGVISAHVYHNDPLIADIMATTFFVMPLEKIDELAKLMGVEYCLVLDDLRCIKSVGFC
ncbi:MAG TPA: FAD:protein FMN transferase [Candidatus Absconditabacterales bacterium]|nr:FAD:protein FMN transferase [Candidatus Absconditabacterales bacterium]